MSTLKKRRRDPIHDHPYQTTIFIKDNCPSCEKTLRILTDHGITRAIVELEKNPDAYTYVTQVLKYKAAPVVVTFDGDNQISWAGHQPDLITEHILAKQDDFENTDRMTQAAANTTNVIRNSGLGGRSTGPHRQIRAED